MEERRGKMEGGGDVAERAHTGTHTGGLAALQCLCDWVLCSGCIPQDRERDREVHQHPLHLGAASFCYHVSVLQPTKPEVPPAWSF